MANTTKRLLLGPALGVFAYLFKAREPKDPTKGKPKYGICLVFPKAEKEKLRALQDAVLAAAKKKFGTEGTDVVDLLKRGKLKNPIRDGDVDMPGDPVFKDAWFVNMSSVDQPGIVDAHVQRIMTAEEAYSGCTFRASVAVFAFDRDGGKGVALGLNNLQVVKKGPRLDGRKPPEEDFKDFVEVPEPAAPGSDLLG